MEHVELVKLSIEAEVDSPGSSCVVVNSEWHLGVETIWPFIGHLELGTVILKRQTSFAFDMVYTYTSKM